MKSESEQSKKFRSFFEELEKENAINKRKERNKRILNGMIEIYENDFMCGYEGEDKQELQVIFLTLIMYVTRYVNDYRYCSRKDCPCSPESHIKRMVEHHEKEIFENLLGGVHGLSEVPLPLQREFLRSFAGDTYYV